jgi:predicted porin
MDLRGIVSSRHLGLAMRGKLDDDGVFGYWVTVANANSGTAPKDVTPAEKNGDKYNLYSLEMAYRPLKEVTVMLYGDFRPTYPVNDPASTAVPKATVANNTWTGALSAAYKQASDFAVGVEAFTQQSGNAYADPASTNKLKTLAKLGVSVWGWYNFSDDLGVIARYDYYDPKSGSDVSEKGDSRNYIIAGLTYKPAKNIQIIPNVQVETYERIPNVRKPDSAITGRLTFAFAY